MNEQQKKDFRIINGNNLEILDNFEPNSVDAVITDPPYELGFMGKKWDSTGIAYNVELWRKVLKVLKPGGYLLAFGGTRTFHRITVAIEDAGFEIRDCIMWLYGSGFPKSHNVGLDIDKLNGCGDRGHRIAVANRYHPDGTLEPNGEKLEKYEGKTEEGKKWAGYGTALKPAFEPIIMARKPIEDTVAKNCLKYGVGAINIDECRVSLKDNETKKGGFGQAKTGFQKGIGNSGDEDYKCEWKEDTNGRFPANVITDGSEEVASGMPQGSTTGHRSQTSINNCIEARKLKKGNSQCDIGGNIDHITEYTDSGSVMRYFYCAKASKKDRDEGLGKDFDEKQNIFMATHNGTGEISKGMERFATQPKKNFHPTVKPTNLMQYLVRLVCPKGGTVLDIFNGSGSTGKAVAFENRERDAGYKYIGIELDPEYCAISEDRIDYALNKYEYESKTETKHESVDVKEGKDLHQMSIFDFDSDEEEGE